MTLSSSRLLSNLQDRLAYDAAASLGASGTKSSKAAAAAVAAARVNANISAAAQQNATMNNGVQKLAVPDLAQKLLKTQMSLDMNRVSKLVQ